MGKKIFLKNYVTGERVEKKQKIFSKKIFRSVSFPRVLEMHF